MRKTVLRITETAAMLALLICFQWLGSFIPEPLVKQLVTGTFVNCVLAVAVFLIGLRGGIAVAVISPVFAFVLGIAQFITVVPIMLGNLCYVVLLRLITGGGSQQIWKQPVALVTAAGTKFLVMYLLVVKVICGLAADALLGKTLGSAPVLSGQMMKALPTMFAWPQLVTALTGGALAFAILPLLRKALHR